MVKTKPSILLVMKDVHERSILLDRFESAGFKAEAVEDIEDGERKAVKLRPNIFFVEWTDQKADIGKTLKHLHSLPTLLKSRKVLYFNRADRGLVDEALKKGADQVMLGGTMTPKEIVKSLTRIL